MSKAISVSTGQIFTIFSPDGRYFLDQVQFFRFLKGRCHGNQLKSKNWRFYRPIYFVALPFGKGLRYRNSDFKRLDRMNISTSSIYIVYNFGDIRSRNLRVYAVNNSTFCGDTAEIGISRQISQNATDLP